MRRFVLLPMTLLGLVVAGSSDCGGATFEVGGDAGFDGASSAGTGGGGSGMGGSGGSSGSGNASGGGGGSGSAGGSSGAPSVSGAASGSGAPSGTGAPNGSGAPGGSGAPSTSGSSSGSPSGSGSPSSGSGSGGGADGGGLCPSNHCPPATTCCGASCCTTAQLCCLYAGPVLPADPYYCHNPTPSQPTCPKSCSPRCVSDRNVKRDIELVDEQAVLEGVSRMAVSTWSYRSEDPSIRHLGPMAQDFHTAFGLGDSDRQYDSIDAHGVAFAAIKALNERLQEQNARIERLEHENGELRQTAACGR